MSHLPSVSQEAEISVRLSLEKRFRLLLEDLILSRLFEESYFFLLQWRNHSSMTSTFSDFFSVSENTLADMSSALKKDLS